MKCTIERLIFPGIKQQKEVEATMLVIVILLTSQNYFNPKYALEFKFKKSVKNFLKGALPTPLFNITIPQKSP
jgi:hypothetical protein